VRSLTCILATVLVAISCGVPEQANDQTSDTPPAVVRGPLKQAPVFTAVDQDGAQWTSASLNGTVWIASFMFTTCGSICPALNAVKASLQREYADQGLRLLSITTDPETDTPPVLRQYANSMGARAGVWSFVTTGSMDSTRKLSVDGFMLMAPDEESHHSTRLVLVDRKGMIRDYFDSADSSEITRLRTAVKVLLHGKDS
jgi:protein SCO1